MVTFVIGGMTGVLLAVPPADFVLHNSLFLVAHFHNVIIGGVLFGAFAGYTYWFPKAFGFRLHEGLGKAAFWCWLIGFYVAFMPLYVLGLMGMTRRMQHYDVAGLASLAADRGSRRGRHPGRDRPADRAARRQHSPTRGSFATRPAIPGTGAPWNGRHRRRHRPSTSRCCPQIEGEDAYWGMKQRALQQARLSDEPAYADIEMPRNSPTGFICAFFATFMGFALIWHIWWMVAVAALGAYATFVVFAWRDRTSTSFRPTTVARIDRANRSARSEALARTAGGVMSAVEAAAGRDPHRVGRGSRDRGDAEHAAGGLVSKRIIVGYGFWIFLLSDIIMFSAFFATYAVLVGADGGRPERAGPVRPAQRRASRRPACSSRASPAASPASAPGRTAGPGSMARWR